MTLPAFDGLDSLPAREHLDLVAAPVATALTGWARTDEVAVVEIDPDLADTAALTEAYALPLEASVNCVLVAGSRGGEERIAACLVAADTRADVNTVVRKLLDVRKASFLPMERAVAESGMEYGGITPIGLPAAWRVLVDAAVLTVPAAMIGSGVRRSKIILPGSALGDLPGAEVVEGLGRPTG
jgi:prolyl-tRNA editing enzyme YbaK/EbsC (Cys-tRNA(Pro) deacylase)